jgi:UTP--glucose-1-phosphate uridylyltransferase
MLPLGRKPVLEYIVEELAACAIREALIVVSPGKEGIRAYFQDGDRFGIHLSYVIQPKMRGLGDAILQGEDWTGGETFLTAFGDAIIESTNHGASRRLLATHNENESFASVMVESVSLAMVSRFGIVSPTSATRPDSAIPFEFGRVLEKPTPEAAPSTWAVAARWVLDTGIFEHLRRLQPDSRGEIGLSQAVDSALVQGKAAWAVPLQPGEQRLDIGSWDTYLAASARAIVRDPEYGEGVLQGIQRTEQC